MRNPGWRLFQDPVRASAGYSGANAPLGLLDDRLRKVDSAARLVSLGLGRLDAPRDPAGSRECRVPHSGAREDRGTSRRPSFPIGFLPRVVVVPRSPLSRQLAKFEVSVYSPAVFRGRVFVLTVCEAGDGINGSGCRPVRRTSVQWYRRERGSCFRAAYFPWYATGRVARWRAASAS